MVIESASRQARLAAIENRLWGLLNDGEDQPVEQAEHDGADQRAPETVAQVDPLSPARPSA